MLNLRNDIASNGEDDWFEKLPLNCPPSDAVKPTGEKYYRLINFKTPTENDFYSHRKLFPFQQFKVNECQARSISVFDSITSCENIRKLPTQRNKFIAEVTLNSDSGLIKKTGKDDHHYSWWILKSFNVLSFCNPVYAEVTYE